MNLLKRRYLVLMIDQNRSTYKVGDYLILQHIDTYSEKHTVIANFILQNTFMYHPKQKIIQSIRINSFTGFTISLIRYI